MMTEDQLFELVAAERRRLADQLDELSAEQFTTPSLCEGWSVLHVAAHLTTPFLVSTPKMLARVVRRRGDFSQVMSDFAKKLAAAGSDKVINDLRSNATHRFTPPGAGAIAPLTDAVVHGLDILVPLGIEPQTPLATFVPILDAWANPPKRTVFPFHDATGLSFRATDQDWSSGEGVEVAGASQDLAMALTGRRHGVDRLAGDGVTLFRQRAGFPTKS